MINPGLKDKVALVTGANNPYGIGAAIARALGAQGARIFLHGYRGAWKGGRPQEGEAPITGSADAWEPGETFYNRQGHRPLQDVLQMLRDEGVAAEGLEGDLSQPAFIEALMDAAEQAYGVVHILVNNAAYWEADSFIPADEERANKAVELWTDRPQPFAAEVFDRIFAVNTRAAAQLMADVAAGFRLPFPYLF